MASVVPLVREYAYVLLRLKNDGRRTKFLNYLCDNLSLWDTKDVFPIGGLVDIGETPIASGSRYCRQLVNFRLIKP